MSFLFVEKNYQEESVFKPENLLRESRRQKNIAEKPVPRVCVLDPDGDIHAMLMRQGKTRSVQTWACYHTGLLSFDCAGTAVGIIPGVVGASFATLVAEQLRVSGCQFIISITSAGKLINNIPCRYMLITDSLRDEGTSCHYIPPETRAVIHPRVLKALDPLCSDVTLDVQKGRAWTTDAPYRETPSAIRAASAAGAMVVEMESSALYAFGIKTGMPVACFAHLTNTMATRDGDFEKGEMNGAVGSLSLIENIVTCVHSFYIPQA